MEQLIDDNPKAVEKNESADLSEQAENDWRLTALSNPDRIAREVINFLRTKKLPDWQIKEVIMAACGIVWRWR